MGLSAKGLDQYIFYFLMIVFTYGMYACGTDEAQNFENKISTTGTYHPILIFPNDIPRKEYIVNALTGFDCNENHISIIEFTFMVNDSPHGPFRFPCQDHQAYIEDIPAGIDIQVDVYAYDENDTAVLYGFEITDITADQVTEGGEIEMKPVDSQNPGTNADSFTIDDLKMTFVRIPAGVFIMGSPVNEPGRGRNNVETLHQVTLTRDFYMQTTEVTQEQWWTVMGNNPSFNTYNCTPDCPVENVSWEDAQGFIRALEERYSGGYDCSLPTEAQWEYAARADSETAFANGDIMVFDPWICDYDQNLDAMGWYCYNSDGNTHSAAQKLPNAWGLYDMHGNVWEWCQDWYHVESYAGPTEDPAGPVTGSDRVTRGGAMNGLIRTCRSATRGHQSPDYFRSDQGFRIVCSLVNR